MGFQKKREKGEESVFEEMMDQKSKIFGMT